MMSTSLASNDPETYENPTEVNLDRPQRHLGFGTGIHNCVGVRLARRELVIAMEQEATKLVEVVQGNRDVEFNGGKDSASAKPKPKPAAAGKGA